MTKTSVWAVVGFAAHVVCWLPACGSDQVDEDTPGVFGADAGLAPSAPGGGVRSLEPQGGPEAPPADGGPGRPAADRRPELSEADGGPILVDAAAAAPEADAGLPTGDNPGARDGGPSATGISWEECAEAADCVEQAENALASLSMPRQDSLAFVSAACTHTTVMDEFFGSVSGPSCHCSIDESASLRIGPVGAGCFVVGRGGHCLWDDQEFSGCTRGEAETCTTVCEELERRLADDAARTFETRVMHATCEQSVCHAVVEIDGSCYADGSYRVGQDYDCSMGGEAILDRHLQPVEGPELVVIPTTGSLYMEGTNGHFRISVNSEYYGQKHLGTGFSASAQFYEVEGDLEIFGEILDPLEGIDDCGVARQSNQAVFPQVEHFDVEEAALFDDGRVVALAPSLSTTDRFFPYSVNLSEQGIEPRFGGSYGVLVSGGAFESPMVVRDIQLPQTLSIPSLEGVSRIERAELRLTWTGRGESPLTVSLSILPTLADSGLDPYRINCSVADDGEFVVPAEVLEAAPEGFVTASFHRQNSFVAESAQNALLVIASVNVKHRLALGERCDGSDVVEACLRHAEYLREMHQQCSWAEAAPIEVLCPDYLAESCQGCPEYFDCVVENTECAPLLTRHLGCACP